MRRLLFALLLACAARSSAGCASSEGATASPRPFDCGGASCDASTHYCLRPRGPGYCPSNDAGCIPGCPGCDPLPPPSCVALPSACVASPTCACLTAAACPTSPGGLCDSSGGGPIVGCISE